MKDTGTPSSTMLIIEEGATDTESIIRQMDNDCVISVVPGGSIGVQSALCRCPDIMLINDGHPDASALETCRLILAQKNLQTIPLMLLTDHDLSFANEALCLGANDCLCKPVTSRLLRARVRKHLEAYQNNLADQEKNMLLQSGMVKKNREILRMQELFIVSLASIAETRDNDTGFHIERTRQFVGMLARELKRNGPEAYRLSESDIRFITRSAPLHDIGKIGIPDHILLKNGTLSPAEFEIIKTHTTIGLQALERAEQMMGSTQHFLHHAKDIVYCHHERWDGNGYPRGLSKTEIPLSARLMAVADVYDALISNRVYKSAMPHDTAVSIIKEERGKHFDPVVVDAFLMQQQRFARILHRKFFNRHTETSHGLAPDGGTASQS